MLHDLGGQVYTGCDMKTTPDDMVTLHSSSVYLPVSKKRVRMSLEFEAVLLSAYPLFEGPARRTS